MFVSYLVVIISIFVMGWYGLILMPFVLGLLRQHIHRCPKCLNAIKENSLFSSLEDNVRAFMAKTPLDTLTVNWEIWNIDKAENPGAGTGCRNPWLWSLL
jgi:uncharacterized protein YqgC (DUF456 family)